MRGTVSYSRKLNRNLQAGIQYQTGGQLAEAEECYRRILKAEPRHADALHLLGVIEQQRGNYPESIRLIKVAIQQNARVSVYHGNLGNTYQRQGALLDAIASYRRALAIEPDNRGFRHSLACALVERGELAEAQELFRKLVKAEPDFAEAHYHLGNLETRRGRPQAAAESYRNAVRLRPDCFEFQFNLAGTLSALGRFAEAADAYRCALQAKPDDTDALYSLGVTLQKRGEMTAAADAYKQTLALDPSHASALSNLGSLAIETGDTEQAVQALRRTVAKFDDADMLCEAGVSLQRMGDVQGAADAYKRALHLNIIHASALSNLSSILIESGDLKGAAQLLKRSLEIEPNSASALCNLGKLYASLGQTTGAIECYQKALAVEPFHATSLCNLGFHLEVLGDIAASMQCYQLTLQHHPESAQARYQLGMMQLAMGNFAEGWANCEARWKTAGFQAAAHRFPQPQWKGEDIRGARILVFGEQGLGDALQFARYVPMLAARGARVYLEVKENVYRLLQNLEGAERVIARGEDLPEFDWQCPLMSLPMGFKTDLNSIPANVPYLKAPEDAVKLWAERLDRFHVQDRFRVGIVWSGNPKHSRERYRAVPLERLAQLSRIDGTAFYSLQKGPGASQVDALGADLAVVNLDEQQGDFTDTAAIVANLDLVITIDTSVAHLAGGMGKPVWILLHSAPDWRWMRERDDSPWYPTARLFRQTRSGNWDDVLEKVRRDLTALVAAHRASMSDLALRGAIA